MIASGNLGLVSKCLPAALLLFVSSSGVRAQNVVPDDPDGPYGIPAVRRALDDRFPPGYGFYGITEKHVNRLGDRASIALIKLLDDEDLKHSEKVIRVLQIIRHSFLYPKMITMEDDRRPKFTLIFLEHLDAVLQDPALKREVSEVRKFVTEQTASPRKMK
jgi:hypothetical protein